MIYIVAIADYDEFAIKGVWNKLEDARLQADRLVKCDTPEVVSAWRAEIWAGATNKVEEDVDSFIDFNMIECHRTRSIEYRDNGRLIKNVNR
jgi:hypothetical protein